MKDEIIYLDNAASSKMDEKVFEAMKPYMLDNFAVALQTSPTVWGSRRKKH